MGSALRILIAVALLLSVGLTACGRRGSLDTPKSSIAQTKADPESTMQKAPDRHLLIDRILE
jgi:predicted small lipoprotein YifL